MLFQIWILLGVSVVTNAQCNSINEDDQQAIYCDASATFSTLPENFHDWSYDIFDLNEINNKHPLLFLVPSLFNIYGLVDKFDINLVRLTNFIDRVENGYRYWNVSYHNVYHSADIARTIHYLIWNTGLKDWMTDLEIFASLFAAIIHDYEHMGLTNDFLIITNDERALIYNDLSVNENHHASASFRLVNDDCCNILSNLTSSQYREFRKLVIDMVLYTDMAKHSSLINKIEQNINDLSPKDQRSAVLSMVLHVSDISNPAKNWSLAYNWAQLVLNEFYKQGDLEQELGLPLCSLCNRTNSVPKSQIYFTDIVVRPSFDVMTTMIEDIVGQKIQTPWVDCIAENLDKWNKMLNADSNK